MMNEFLAVEPDFWNFCLFGAITFALCFIAYLLGYYDGSRPLERHDADD